MYINSPGGSIYAGLAIYDTMQMIPAPVSTYAVGVTASMGTVLLAAGAKGRRYALPHATIHLHPASSGAQGYTEDVRIAFREQERVQTQLFHLVGKHTGHSWKDIEHDFERDRYMNVLEAKEYGLVDEILGGEDDIVQFKDGEIVVPSLNGEEKPKKSNGASSSSRKSLDSARAESMASDDMTDNTHKPEPRCSFCGKSRSEVQSPH